MSNEIIKYEKQFKIEMSNKSEFNISEKEMNLFTECANNKWVYEMRNWTLINTAFFMTASPFNDFDMTDYEIKKISEHEARIWWKLSASKKEECLRKLRKWKTLYN